VRLSGGRKLEDAPASVRWIGVAVLLVTLLLWLAALFAASERIPAARDARDRLVETARRSLAQPIVKLGERGLTGLDLLTLPLLVAVVWVVVTAGARLVQGQLQRGIGVERGAVEGIFTLGRYGLIFLGIVVVLQARGIDAGSLAIVASVVGVGIGFGLQNIANNFVSGILLGVERPIAPGDYVELEGHRGLVQRIGARSTEVRTRDGITILVPNSKFLETVVVNWSHGDPAHQLHVPVSIAYGSPAVTVRTALLEAAAGHPRVMKEPPPRVELTGFGDSALHFDLMVWSKEPEEQHSLKSDLHFRIVASLARHRIAIPFPQRDLHLRSAHLDRLVEAWGRKHFSSEELGPAGERGAETPPHQEGTRQGASWADIDLEDLVRRMRGPEGVAVQDRKHLLRSYPSCFIGSEAVDWLVRSEGLARGDATALGELLVERGAIRHVLDEHGFEDAGYFYRFC